MSATICHRSADPLVLILAEEPEFLTFLHDLLGEEGNRVEARCWDTFNRDELMALQPRLLIVEVELVTGRSASWDLLRDLTNGRMVPPLPVLVISTDPHALDRTQELNDDPPCWRYLPMPFDLEECLVAVASLMGPGGYGSPVDGSSGASAATSGPGNSVTKRVNASISLSAFPR